jgi:uncharacterized membrane protein YfcA
MIDVANLEVGLPAMFASLSPLEFALIAVMGVFTSLIGGVAGYGTGALMPLVLVPILGAEPVVPIITIAGMFTNVSRAAAFRKWVDRPRALIVCVCAVPTAVLGAWGYTMLTGKGALLVIGAMMIASVVLRRVLKHHGFALGEGGLAAASVGWGVIVGGTTGAGIVLLSMLMAAGIEGAAVIATDATISIVIGVFKLAVFGIAGVYDAKVIAIALLIGLVAFPGAFLAKLIVERLPIHMHTAILDAVVVMGGAIMISGGLRN